MAKQKQPYFGLKGGWLTVWITVCPTMQDPCVILR